MRVSWSKVMSTGATAKDKVRWMLSFGEYERYRWEGRLVLGWIA
jgi:hypothetical protein